MNMVAESRTVCGLSRTPRHRLEDYGTTMDFQNNNPTKSICWTRRSSKISRSQPKSVESGTGAPTLGSGGNSDAFATGLSPSPIITFPVPAHRTQRANFQHWALQWDHAPRTQKTGAAATTTCRPSGSPMTCVEDARLPPLATLHSRSAIKPAYASMAPLRSTKLRRPKRPFTYACDASGICGTHRGHRHCHSRRLSPFSHPSSPEAPFLDRHYPASSVVRASPPPCQPGLTLAGFRLMRAHHQQMP